MISVVSHLKTNYKFCFRVEIQFLQPISNKQLIAYGATLQHIRILFGFRKFDFRLFYCVHLNEK